MRSLPPESYVRPRRDTGDGMIMGVGKGGSPAEMPPRPAGGDAPLLRIVSELARYDRTVRSIAERVLCYARGVVPCDGAALYGLARSGDRLASLGSDRMNRSLLREGRSAAGTAMAVSAPVSMVAGAGGSVFACAPIRESSRAIGCYLAYWTGGGRPGPDDARNIEQIACLAHIAAHHYRAVESHGRIVSDIVRRERHARGLSRLASIGQGAAEMIHEVSNLVTMISGWAELFRAANDPGEKDAFARRLSSAALAFGERARQILPVAGADALRGRIVDLRELVRGVAEARRPILQAKGIALTCSAPRGKIELRAHPYRIEQVVVNLIQNALDAVRKRRTKRIAVRLRRRGGMARIEVEDSGGGVPAGMEEMIFRPFVTTKPDGSGLGLSISREIAREMGGRLRVEGCNGRGARFVFELPLEAREEGKQPGAGETYAGVEQAAPF